MKKTSKKTKIVVIAAAVVMSVVQLGCARLDIYASGLKMFFGQ